VYPWVRTSVHGDGSCKGTFGLSGMLIRLESLEHIFAETIKNKNDYIVQPKPSSGTHILGYF
jgi:hypothetical protein